MFMFAVDLRIYKPVMALVSHTPHPGPPPFRGEGEEWVFRFINVTSDYFVWQLTAGKMPAARALMHFS